ncbi:MAG TPA: ribosome-binding factor A, partial [Thermoanaerobaculia bacterium]|nr:ribosome-binding factor A [Thermoanaerobaculia bacterium]
RFALDSTFDTQSRIDAILRSPEVARDLGDHRANETEDD